MNTDHAETACRLFAEGCNCSQAIFTAFTDVTGLDKETALTLSSSFGGGMGRLREVCGACSGMFMVAGLLYGYSDVNDISLKTEHYKRIQYLAARFKERYDTIICRELLKNLSVSSDPVPEKRTEQYYKVRPCVRFIRAAAEILDEYNRENPIKNNRIK